MVKEIAESDWKLLREFKPLALERFCKRVLADLKSIASKTPASDYERYLAVFDLIKGRDKELARVFDDLRRSNALERLAFMVRSQLLSQEEISQFSLETRNRVKVLLGILPTKKRSQRTPP